MIGYRFHILDDEKGSWITGPSRVDAFCDLYTLDQVKKHIDYWHGKRKWDARVELIDGAKVQTFYPDEFPQLFSCLQDSAMVNQANETDN